MFVLSQDKQIWWQPCRPSVPDNEHLARLYPTINREKIKTIHIFSFYALCNQDLKFSQAITLFPCSIINTPEISRQKFHKQTIRRVLSA